METVSDERLEYLTTFAAGFYVKEGTEASRVRDDLQNCLAELQQRRAAEQAPAPALAEEEAETDG